MSDVTLCTGGVLVLAVFVGIICLVLYMMLVWYIKTVSEELSIIRTEIVRVSLKKYPPKYIMHPCHRCGAVSRMVDTGKDSFFYHCINCRAPVHLNLEQLYYYRNKEKKVEE